MERVGFQMDASCDPVHAAFFLRVNRATIPATMRPKIRPGMEPDMSAVQKPVMPVTSSPFRVTVDNVWRHQFGDADHAGP